MLIESIDDFAEYCEKTGTYWYARVEDVRVGEALSVRAALQVFGYRLGRRTRAVWKERNELREIARPDKHRKK